MSTKPFDRRQFIAYATAMGAAWAIPNTSLALGQAPEEDLLRFPEGVASGDPDSNSVLLWTRREPIGAEATATLLLEVSYDPDFDRVLLRKHVAVTPSADWTCRVLVGGLAPSRFYWLSTRCRKRIR